MAVLLSGAPDGSLEALFLLGLRNELRRAQPSPGAPFGMVVTFLEFNRVRDDPEHLAAVERLMLRRQAQREFKAVVTNGPLALRYALQRRDLWPGVPIVFSGISADELRSLTLPSDVVGATAQWDVAGTVALARHLLPATRHVLLVAGPAPVEQRLAETAKQALTALDPPVTVIAMTGRLDWNLVVQQASNMPANSFILPVGMSTDAAGNPLDQLQAFELGAKLANAPMFMLNAVTFGLGGVGGRMIDFESVGRDAGHRVAALLKGTLPETLGVQTVDATRSALDGRALERWGIPISLVPADVSVENRQASLWRDYRWQVVSALGIIGVMSLALTLVLIERRGRHRAERVAQDQLVAVGRMERASAMGQLSASLAHEINHPLGSMTNYAEGAERLLRLQPPPLEKIAQALRAIRQNGQRAGEVIERVRAAFSPDSTPYKPVSLAAVARETMALLGTEAARRGVQLTVQHADSVPLVQGDSVQLQQVLLNLLLNGLDACEGRPAARVGIVLQRHPQGVEMQVWDNGCGIPSTLSQTIFEPFFTTKMQGMGMGLVLVRRIVLAHSGHVKALARDGGGTTLSVVLPAHEAAAATTVSAS